MPDVHGRFGHVFVYAHGVDGLLQEQTYAAQLSRPEESVSQGFDWRIACVGALRLGCTPPSGGCANTPDFIALEQIRSAVFRYDCFLPITLVSQQASSVRLPLVVRVIPFKAFRLTL